MRHSHGVSSGSTVGADGGGGPSAGGPGMLCSWELAGGPSGLHTSHGVCSDLVNSSMRRSIRTRRSAGGKLGQLGRWYTRVSRSTMN